MHNGSSCEIAQWDKTLQTALVTADSTSRQQDGRIKELEQSVIQLKAAKLVVEEEAKKEKAAVEEAMQATDEVKKEVEDAAKKALLASEELRSNLEAQVTCVEARAKMAGDILAKEQAEMEEKIKAEENDIIDMAIRGVQKKKKTDQIKTDR